MQQKEVIERGDDDKNGEYDNNYDDDGDYDDDDYDYHHDHDHSELTMANLFHTHETNVMHIL